MKEIKIAFLGFGVVGQGTYTVLTQNKKLIENRLNCDIKVVRILEAVKSRYGLLGTDSGIFTDNFEDILNDESVQIVVEMMGGIDFAADCMEKALLAGKHVVSSNKAALAARLPKLNAAAKEGGAILLYEASVGGAIPVMHAVQTSLAANEFLSIEGIVNGTSNYILTKMSKEGLSYEQALKQAQKKGFAEADPTADVEGIDSANKLCLLTANAFGFYADPAKIERVGITGVTPEQIKQAESQNSVIKLIAKAEKQGDGFELSVKPQLLPSDHPLASVDNEFNAIRIVGNMCDEIFLKGRGAGSLPTGSAVAGDILEIAGFIASNDFVK